MNPVTGDNEPYYRIKESYRDRLAREYFSQMEAKGTIDTFQEKKRRDENSLQGRLLLKGDTLEHKEGRDLGAEWLCLQTVRKLGLDKLDDYLTRRTDSLLCLTNRIFLFDLTNFYFESPKRSSRKAKFGRSKELPIKLTEVRSTTSGDHYLLVNSPSKALTEESMNRQYRQRFEDMLEAIRKGLSAKGGTKRYEKVCEGVGRARGKYPSVQRFYDISYILDEKGATVTGIDWTIKTPEKMDADIVIYFLRTDKPEMDEKTTPVMPTCIWDCCHTGL